MQPDQDAVFELMRARLLEMFGPGGSFRISLGRATAEDAVFVATVADTVAYAVAAKLTPVEDEPVGRRVDAADPEEAEYRRIWKHVEAELLRRRAAEDPLDVPARSHAHSAA
jgi:hypothetical protein